MLKQLKRFLWHFLHLSEHNDHYIPITLFGKEIKACARCLGVAIGSFIVIPALFFLTSSEGLNFLTILFFKASGRFELWDVVLVSWLLASFAIADWGTIKLKIRKGDNRTRFTTGIMLGVAEMIFLFLMPQPLIINAMLLASFWISFSFIWYIAHCKELNLSLRNPIPNNLAAISAAVPLTIGQGFCAQTGGCCECCTCCPCGNCGACCCNPLCCCVGVIPIICLIKSMMDRGEKKQNA